MAEYRVVCVERRPAVDHRHIVGVGVTRGARTIKHMSVKDVRKAIKARTDSFYTIDEATGRKVPVRRAKCCGQKSIRSVVDGTKADILDALSSCNRLTWYMTK